MRFKIRFADQLVGILAVIAAAVLALVIILLGRGQRWFARDYLYISYFESASGLGLNMAVQYKGFTIGNIKSVRLTEDDRVEAIIAVYDSYVDRVREGSLVELMVSPIGLGNQFLFHAGLGETRLAEGAVIPNIHSPEGRSLIAQGLARTPDRDDSITLIISRANTVLDNLNQTVVQVNEALAGNDSTALGRILGNVEGAVVNVSSLAGGVEDSITRTLADLRPVISNLETLSSALASPDSSVAALLDPQEEVYTGLVSTARSLSGTLRNVEKISGFVPPQLPQLALILSQLREALQTGEDVLVALTNNPLLKNGVPSRVNTQSGGTSSRDVAF